MRLTDCFVDLVAYVAYFLKNVENKQPPFDKVKADIQRLMSETENRMRDGGFSQEDYDSARFAVCAWVDEAILSSPWKEKIRWQGEQLQRIYYQTSDAGEIFFDRLNTLGPHQRDVREVYYLCLAMGFMGRYCNAGDEYLLDQLKTSNLKLLTGSSVGIPDLNQAELFPESYPAGVGDTHLKKGGFRFTPINLLFMGSPVVLFVFLFIIYHFVLGNVGEALMKG
jgi:type VI secretion system protein ImpK